MEDFVTFNLAKKLKDKGFIGNGKIGCCCGFYCEEGFDINIVYDDLDNSELLCNEYLRPTIAQVLKWLRKEKKIYVTVNVEYEDWFEYKIVQLIKNTRCSGNNVYNTYDDAMSAGIEYVLDNLI